MNVYFKLMFRVAASLGGAFAAMQFAEWIGLKLGCAAFDARTVIVGSGLIALLLFLVQGCWVEGFLRKSADLALNGVGSKIRVLKGDIFQQEGLTVVQVNDFFDTLVDDIHIASDSLHGELVKRFWGGNTADLDEQIEQALAGVHYEEVERDGKVKTRRYPIGTCAFVKSEFGKRFLLVVLTHTDPKTHETTSDYEDLTKAIECALVAARQYANGMPVSFPVMGGRNAKINLPRQILFNTLLSGIVAESNKRRVAEQINIVLWGKTYGLMNLANLREQWRS